MPLIVVASGKGGVTKTTTTYALGAALRELDLDPQLLDLDPGASLTENAGLIADGSHAYDLLEGAQLQDVALASGDGTPLVPGTMRLLTLDEDRGRLARWARRLRDIAVDSLVIADTAQGLSLPATRAALLAADYVVVPMQAEPAVLKRSYPDVIAMLRAYRADAELATQFALKPSLLFVLTKHNARLGLARHELDKLAKDGLRIAATVPSGVAAAEACLAGRSVVTYAPKSPVTEGYRELARSILAELNRGKAALTA